MTDTKRRGLAVLTHSITPVLTVLVCGVVGAYLVYDNYLSDRNAAEQVVGFEPASGTQAQASPAKAATATPPSVVPPVTSEGEDADDTDSPTYASGRPAQ